MPSRCFLQGDVLTTKYQVDLGDGFKAMYMNLTVTGEPIRHRYESPGIYRVSVRAENTAGHDEAVLFVQVNCKSTAPRGQASRSVARPALGKRGAPSGPQCSGRGPRGRRPAAGRESPVWRPVRTGRGLAVVVAVATVMMEVVMAMVVMVVEAPRGAGGGGDQGSEWVAAARIVTPMAAVTNSSL